MGLSDKKLPNFNGQIKFWTTNLNISDEGLDCALKLSIRIENHSNTPINDLIIKFKTPANISSLIDENNNYVKLFKHGRTILYIDDSFGILGSNSENDYLHYDFIIKFGKWKSDNLYFTINGSNIQTKCWSIKYSEMALIKNAKSKSEYILN